MFLTHTTHTHIHIHIHIYIAIKLMGNKIYSNDHKSNIKFDCSIAADISRNGSFYGLMTPWIDGREVIDVIGLVRG